MVDRLSQHFSSMLNCFVLDATAADGAGDELARRDEHLSAGVLGRTPLSLDHRHAYKGDAAVRQLGQSFDKSMWRGHRRRVQDARYREREFYDSPILASAATPMPAMPI